MSFRSQGFDTVLEESKVNRVAMVPHNGTIFSNAQRNLLAQASRNNSFDEESKMEIAEEDEAEKNDKVYELKCDSIDFCDRYHSKGPRRRAVNDSEGGVPMEDPSPTLSPDQFKHSLESCPATERDRMKA